MIQFLLNDQLININNERADLTLLNYLRDTQNLTGTKEGCASGDCGACTVVLAEPSHSHATKSNNNAQTVLSYKAINSCVTFLSALQGKQVITVEHLQTGNTLHPVQKAMVESNATQCGFCTPGFVMSIFALYQQRESVDKERVITALSGNLCRCTGYQAIIKAALHACNAERATDSTEKERQIAQQLNALNIQSENTTSNLFLPKTRQQLATYIQQFPDAMLVAGSTDVALLHTQQLQALDKLICLTHIDELQKISIINNALTIGAACTLSDIQPILLTHFPSLREIIERFASVPIRNQATLGGNIANASPIGDMAPVLLALNASVVLDDGNNMRTVMLNEFFTAYRETVMQNNEWIHSIEIPLLTDQQYLVAYKISKRFEDDISAVCMAVNITLEKGKIVYISTGFGGVASTPTVCKTLEDSLIGKKWQSIQCRDEGQQILMSAFSPISDVRASAAYRKLMLGNLWHRFWVETNAQENTIATRVIHHA